MYWRLIQKHHLEARLGQWETSWTAFIRDRDFKQYARKPVYARIGVHGHRVTNRDLMADTEDHELTDEGDVVSFQPTNLNRELSHCFNRTFFMFQ